MGIFNSKDKQPEPSLLDVPWRKVPWGNNEEVLQYVQNYKPANENIEHVRVLLYGPVGAGKSSFINTVGDIMQRRMTNSAAAFATTSDKSFTKHYRTHKIQKGRGAEKTFYSFVFNDIMGVEDGTDCGVCPEDIKLVLKGHVKEGYRFIQEISMPKDGPYYNKDPTPNDKIHVLVCVLSANVAEFKKSVLDKMKLASETARDLGIPQMAIMTNIDAACPDTEKDLKNVYRSKYLQKKMKEFSSAVGIPMKYIFPVKNYSHEIELDDDVDTLILSSLKNMINFGDDFVEKNVPV